MSAGSAVVLSMRRRPSSSKPPPPWLYAFVAAGLGVAVAVGWWLR